MTRRPLQSLGVKVAKVKKSSAVTGVRNATAGAKVIKRARAKAKVASTGSPAKPRPRKAIARPKGSAKPRFKVGSRRSPPPTVVKVVVKPLEPRHKCGSGTSVQLLFRVDETVDGRSTKHLVFFDRHGWYCEHGRHCPAVGHAKKHKGHIARAS
jgi:hypothetical protein